MTADFLTQRDKQQHIALAAVLTALGIVFGLSPTTAIFAIVGLGTLKEFWDARYGTGYSWADQLANIIGIGLGLTTAAIIPYAP